MQADSPHSGLEVPSPGRSGLCGGGGEFDPRTASAAGFISIGVAIPADRNTYGYLSEHHSFGETENAAGEYAEELAAEMLATTLNVEFDPDRSWDEKKEIYRISNKIVRTANVTQSAVGDKRGLVDDGHRLGDFDLRLDAAFGEGQDLTGRALFYSVYLLLTFAATFPSSRYLFPQSLKHRDTISGKPTVASRNTSPNLPPSAGGTNLPQEIASL